MLVGKVAFLASLIANAAATIDTSPMALLSNIKSLEMPQHAMQTQRDFSELISNAVHKCQYDSYVFVQHPNVTDGDITKDSMPFLYHALKKAESSVAVGSVVGTAHKDDLSKTTLEYIQSQCGAEELVANTQSEMPLASLSGTKPKVITVRFSADESLAAVDETLRRVIGHLESGNFFMSYHTTPRHTSKQSASGTKGSEIRILGHESDSKELPYESVFRNYQFFSPALFMGLIISTLLIVVFLIALKSVQSLQISTAAFEPSIKHTSQRKQR